MKNKIQKLNIDNFPSWSLCYFVNGDATGYCDEDIAMMDEYRNNLIIDLCAKWIDICPSDDEPNFSLFPEFGEACDVVKVTILFEVNNALKHFKSKGIKIITELPEGWKVNDGATTAPDGYVWVNNNKPLFGGQYKHALLKLI